MEIKNLDEKILQQLQAHKIKPKGRWYFLLKNYSIWFVGILALLAAGTAVSIMIYFFRYSDFGMRGEINKSWAEMLILTMPYLWILFLGIFVFVIYYNLKHTKTGYRYPIWLIITVAVSASIFLGGFFTLIGWGEELDEMLEKQTPVYGQMMNPHIAFWSNPEEGRLLGITSSPLKDNEFNLVDKDDKEWTIVTREEDEKFMIVIGQPIRLLGEKKSDTRFEVIRIMPMMPGRGFFKHMGPGRPNMSPPMMSPIPMTR
jgi:glucan phosphoethanolaminetransferase (alkaline phosphatase superfamily)